MKKKNQNRVEKKYILGNQIKKEINKIKCHVIILIYLIVTFIRRIKKKDDLEGPNIGQFMKNGNFCYYQLLIWHKANYFI